jgi:hypothetical protein
MKVQIKEYVNFIRDFSENTNIMSKHFFVVIPYAASLLSKGGGSVTDKLTQAVPSLPIIGNKKDKSDNPQKAEESFLDNKTQLEQRASVVEQGLHRMGLRCARLGTEELVEFYYKMFNPGDLAKPAKMN